MSNNSAIAFAVGALLGAGITYICMKSKVETEINDVRESISDKIIKEEEKEEKLTLDKGDLFKKAEELLSDHGYSYSSEPKKTIYEIEGSEAGENGYKLENLVHHTDGIITDDENNPVEDYPKHLGMDYLQILNDSNKDFIYIRNENEEVDYQIEKSDSAYSYIEEAVPHKRGKKHIDYDDEFEDEED